MFLNLKHFVPLLWVSFLKLGTRKIITITNSSLIPSVTLEGYNITWVNRKWQKQLTSCLDSHTRLCAALGHLSFAYRLFFVKQEFWRTVLPYLGKVWHSPSFVSYLFNLDNVVSMVEAREVSCSVANFAILKTNSTWSLFDSHHPFLK